MHEVPTLTLELSNVGGIAKPDTAVVEVGRIDGRFGALFQSLASTLPIAFSPSSMSATPKHDLLQLQKDIVCVVLCTFSQVFGRNTTF
jgi:hypothetical protein